MSYPSLGISKFFLILLVKRSQPMGGQRSNGLNLACWQYLLFVNIQDMLLQFKTKIKGIKKGLEKLFQDPPKIPLAKSVFQFIQNQINIIQRYSCAFNNLCAINLTRHSQHMRKNSTFKGPLAIKGNFPLLAKKEPRLEIQNLLDGYDHLFRLKGRSADCYYHNIKADFNDIKTPEGQQCQRKTSVKERCLKNYPIYNYDKKDYTSSFVLGVDLLGYNSTPTYNREKFQSKVKEAVERVTQSSRKKREQIYVPKPNSSKCQICKCQYEDYLEHIKQQSHISRNRSSLGTLFINQFAEKYNGWAKNGEDHEQRNRTKIKSVKIDQDLNKGRKNEIQSLINEASSIFKTKTICKKQRTQKNGRNFGYNSTYITLS